MDWQAEAIKGVFTLITVALGGGLAWRAGLNLRVEDDIRRAYADLFVAFEAAVSASATLLERWQMAEPFRSQDAGHELSEAIRAHRVALSGFNAAVHRVLLLDREFRRNDFVRRQFPPVGGPLSPETISIVRSVDNKAPKEHQNGGNGAFDRHVAVHRQNVYDFRDSLPRHFTSLGEVFGSD
jgi:hypothetical protein